MTSKDQAAIRRLCCFSEDTQQLLSLMEEVFYAYEQSHPGDTIQSVQYYENAMQSSINNQKYVLQSRHLTNLIPEGRAIPTKFKLDLTAGEK